MIREELLALADELEAFEGYTCERCAAYEQTECRIYLPCTEIVAKYCARKMREAVERDVEGATTVSAYDLLPEEDSKALAWMREHGGLDAVEKRLMPEGMEWLLDVWPRWSNGEYCKFGDWWKADKYGDYEPKQLRRLVFYTPEQLREWGHDEGKNFGYEWNYMRPSDTTYRPDKVEPRAPKVLDADGVEIGIGDKLYDTNTGCAHIVRAINPNGTVELEGYEDRVWFTIFLTHRAPAIAADGVEIREGDTVWDVESGIEYEVVGIHTDEDSPVRVMRTDGSHLAKAAKPSTLTHERPETRQSIVDEIGDEMAKRIDAIVSAGRWQGTRTKGEQQ